MRHRCPLLLLMLASLTLAGCYLVFRYEDRAPDGAVPDKQVREDGKPKDLPKKKKDKGPLDRRVADKKVADKMVADKMVADKKVADKKVADKKVADKMVADKGKLDQKPPLDQKVAADMSVPWVWKKANSSTTKDLRAVWGSSSTDVRACGKGGAILRYDGTSWKVNVPYSYLDLYGLWSSGTTVHYVGYNTNNTVGTWLHFKPNVYSPKPDTSTLRVIRAVHGAGANNVYAAGDKGLIYKLSNTPSVWTPVTFTAIFGMVRYTDLHTTSAGVTLLVTDNGVVVRLVNGVYKAHKAMAGKPELTGIWPRPGGGMFVASEEGQIYRIDETTLVAQSAFNNPNVEWTDIRGNSKGRLYAVGKSGTNGRYLPYESGKWGPIKTVTGSSSDPINFEAVWVADNGRVFIVGDKGLIYQYGPP